MMMMSTDLSKYKRFAEEVVSGERVAGLYLRQACQRYLSFFDREDLEFRPSEASKPVKFIQLLKLSGDRFEGQSFKLQPWQKFIIYSIYGFYYKESGDRLVQRAYILISRKNGKTALCSALALYHLILGEDGQQIVCGANSRDQATLLKKSTADFISKLPEANKELSTYRSNITYKKRNNELKVISADASTLDGLNPSVGIIDEYHAATNSDLYNVIKTGQLMRSNPLIFIISTAGANLTSPCYDLEIYSRRVLNNEISDDNLFCCMWELDQDDDYNDEKNWYKASPGLGVTVKLENMRNDAKAANQQSDAELAHFLTKNLNCWLKGGVAWIQQDVVNKYSTTLDSSVFKGDVYIGLDLSVIRDITAVSVLKVTEDSKYYFKNYYYLPENSLNDHPLKDSIKKWNENGYITLTKGNTIDYDYIKDDILKFSDNENGEVGITKLSFDAWNATYLIKELNQESINCKPYSQSIGNFNRPTKEFERLLYKGDVILDSNPITLWMFGNVVIRQDNNGNIKPEKDSNNSARKIDGIIAILMALGGYMDDNLSDVQIFSI